MAAIPSTPAGGAGSYGDDDEMDPGAGAAPAQDDGSYVIEIRVSGNKDISVCVESGAEEAGEEQGGGEGGEEDDTGGGGMGKYTPCKTIKEALTLALAIYRNDGQQGKDPDEDFQQGFEGAKP